MAETVVTSMEAPSGKDIAYENFPVGSWLLPARLRPHVAVFYAYARAIDDIADDPKLPPEEKIARLTGFEAALLGREQGEGFAKAHAMRKTLSASGISVRHCLDLISAFKQDATQARYRSWDDLIDYCNRSAAPVGRFLLDLHGGGRNGYAAADALCNALQVINHLQDCQEDYRLLNRVYLPCDWLAEAGAAVEDLDRSRTTLALRRVIDRMLDATEALLATAQRLPGELKSRRLGMESSAILAIARLLVQRLRARDPLAGRVALSKAEYAWCCIRGAGAALG
jgi:squalene synthase HpnC